MDLETKQKYEDSGFLGKLVMGERPGILVVDFQKGFTKPELSPLASHCPNELQETLRILKKARERNIPIFFCVIGYQNDEESGVWGQKGPSLRSLIEGTELVELDESLEHQKGETIIVKKWASAFVGTPLAAYLTSKSIDTLIITGTTTSGCIRASAVDAISNGFKPVIVKDAVCDRLQEAHENSLKDMEAKYTEIYMTEDVLSYLDTINQNTQGE